ncbi:hypothetical protein BDV95DRAFT_671413 [Massariosphaeria phaeospora]|uniref:Major facilitator superfamily domain-containing protein n=1 Tax=Massariosphaeria phaeospora TaxID=100035 RepID=A0A7C8MHH5_9PLEO|nr:hypothetical protein BDV95DRAFT_671413 [Massariosphaeria phaeospora]
MTFFIGFCLLPNFEIPAEKKDPPFDYLGLGTFTAGTALLVYGFNDAESRGWKAASTITTIIVGGLLLVAFPFIEGHVKAPAVPQSLLGSRYVLVPLTAFGFVGGGWMLFPATVASMIGGAIANCFVGKGQIKLLIVCGYVISTAALISWGLIPTSQGPWYTIVFAMIYLSSAPPIVVGAQTLVLHEIPVADHGTASALMNVSY